MNFSGDANFKKYFLVKLLFQPRLWRIPHILAIQKGLKLKTELETLEIAAEMG
jgi:hypothetical protein